LAPSLLSVALVVLPRNDGACAGAAAKPRFVGLLYRDESLRACCVRGLGVVWRMVWIRGERMRIADRVEAAMVTSVIGKPALILSIGRSEVDVLFRALRSAVNVR